MGRRIIMRHCTTYEIFEQLKGRFWESVDFAAHYAKQAGIYNDQFEQNALQVANTVRPLSTQRFFENSRHIFGDPRFDFTIYTELFLSTYKKCGHNVGDYFTVAYPTVIESGLDPNTFHYFVGIAVMEGGRRFGAWCTSYIPEIHRRGGDLPTFIKDALRVYKFGGLNLLKPFVRNAAALLELGVTTTQFADLAEDTTNNFGNQTAYWIVKNVAGLTKLGYGCKELAEDTTRLLETHGKQAASWFVSGFSGIVDPLEILDKNPDPPHWAKALHQQRGCLDPQQYKRHYLELLDTGEQKAATFYSFAIRPRGHSILALPKNFEYLESIPASIQDLHKRVSRKVFSEAAWFIPKTAADPSFVPHLLDDIANFFETYGEQSTVDAIRYTYGMRRRGTYPSDLHFNFGRGTAQEDPMTEEEWKSLLKHKIHEPSTVPPKVT